MPGKMKPRFTIINDVSEREADKPLIEEFIGNIYPFPRLVKASDIRRKVFNRLRHETRQRKYDLILLGDRGGTLLFTDPGLKGFGKRVRRLPYSMHAMEKEWLRGLESAAGSLGEKPRVLLLEADVGKAGHTADKLALAKQALMRARVNGEVDIMAGVANKDARGVEKYKYVASLVHGTPERLSELLEKSKHGTELHYRHWDGIDALRELMRKRSLYTGRLPH